MTIPQNSTNARLLGWASRLSAIPVTAIVVMGGCLLAWPTGAQAQINPFRGYTGPTLSGEDLHSGQAAAARLLSEDQGQVGKSEDWAGPTSGNTGSISVQKAFQQQGMDCRALRSEVRYKKAATSPPRVFNLNVCKIKTGEWKLM